MLIKLNKKFFTLVEVLISLLIITMAVTTVVIVSSTSIEQGQANISRQIAGVLSNAIKEKTSSMTLPEMNTWLKGSGLELSDKNKNGPIRGDGDVYRQYSDFTQTVSMKFLSSADLTKVSAASSNAAEIQVVVKELGKIVEDVSWVVFE